MTKKASSLIYMMFIYFFTFSTILLFSQTNKSIVIVSKIINNYNIAISRMKVSQKQFHLNTWDKMWNLRCNIESATFFIRKESPYYYSLIKMCQIISNFYGGFQNGIWKSLKYWHFCHRTLRTFTESTFLHILLISLAFRIAQNMWSY